MTIANRLTCRNNCKWPPSFLTSCLNSSSSRAVQAPGVTSLSQCVVSSTSCLKAHATWTAPTWAARSEENTLKEEGQLLAGVTSKEKKSYVTPLKQFRQPGSAARCDTHTVPCADSDGSCEVTAGRCLRSS